MALLRDIRGRWLVGLLRSGRANSMANAASVSDIASRLQLDPPMTELFLNACVGLGLCDKRDDRFSNSLASETFLASASPSSMGNSISFMDDLYPTWGDLEQALRSGQPDPPVPWQRVINAQGRVSTGPRQQHLLEQEGVVFNPKGVTDLHRFGWQGPDRDWATAHGFFPLNTVGSDNSQLDLF